MSVYGGRVARRSTAERYAAPPEALAPGAARGICTDLVRHTLAEHKLVTGDQDLLAVAGAVAVPIVTPRGCWDRLRGASEG